MKGYHRSLSVVGWGHVEKVGDDHCTMLTDDIFDRVAGPNQASQKSGVQYSAEMDCIEPQLAADQ